MLLKKIISIIFLYSLFSCQKEVTILPEAEFDTPEHHIAIGYRLLEDDMLDAAFMEFSRAKELDPEFSPSYVGMSVVESRRRNFKDALENLETADSLARNDEQEGAVNLGYMRYFIEGKEGLDKKWLKRVEKYSKKAKKLLPGHPEPYFYMGIAYMEAFEFDQSASQFVRVLELDNGLVEKANREYASVQKIKRAMPGSSTGKKIAIARKISRADMAALLIEEIKIDELFYRISGVQHDNSYIPPVQNMVVGSYVKLPPATDIKGHVLKYSIDKIIELNLRGLQPFPDHTFQPDKTLTRAEFAMVMEDIIVKVTGDESLATKFFGSVSPFPDVRNDQPFFNAVMICTTRNIMDVHDLRNGRFDPLGTLSGADALLGVRELKSQF